MELEEEVENMMKSQGVRKGETARASERGSEGKDGKEKEAEKV